MSFEVEGQLHKVFDTEEKTATFKAREFVIETLDGQYNQYVKFQLVQDRCEIIDEYNEGDKIKVFFDLRGREWNGKYFTNLNAWRVEKVEEGGAGPLPQDDAAPFPTQEPPGAAGDEGGDGGGGFDDLPF